ncbi:hypothetical protein B0H17DRAFT_1089359 [Mycena rosella]|uniref:Uncharacterized protein n=1 Tax=Mycena rosella TaxID=1033263 RepID=A0AAD7CW07_MYCRO|nr:hypothetical protein B0H17DRAFT_1117514 [Mycena rosella]KAJ7667023.1 hypothetical protein B0H17DRAFT_1089359 [Mycena rosella]
MIRFKLPLFLMSIRAPASRTSSRPIPIHSDQFCSRSISIESLLHQFTPDSFGSLLHLFTPNSTWESSSSKLLS